MSSPLLQTPLRAVLLMAALLAIPYASPRLSRFRVAKLPGKSGDDTVIVMPAATSSAAPVSSTALDIHATENNGTVTNALPEDKSAAQETAQAALEKAGIKTTVDFEDESHALDAFYKHLAATDKHEAITRIIHYGDSVLTSDLISGTARRRFQERFGDSGHGFILAANAWDWYYHNDVFHSASDGWSIYRIVGPWVGDGMYGPGAVSFQSSGGASATFGTAIKGEFGKRVARFDIYYLEQPGGGDLEAHVDGGETMVIHTRGEKKTVRVAPVKVTDGAAKLVVRARGNIRIYGVALEREEPGVVYDAMGINGARATLFGDQMNGAHWKEAMDLRDPSLVILNFGTNESEAGVVDPKYTEQLGTLIEKAKAAAPRASILVMSPIDRAGKGSDGELKTRRVILELVDKQREIARAHNVAFYNMFEAMGGKGTMAKWVRSTPQLGTSDMTHPTPAGGEVLGDILFNAVLRGYAKYQSR